MKKILYGMMAATMIFATSCENELELGAAGEESMVSFTIATPDMGSRADYSDGTTATVLQYAVYNAAGEELTDLTVTDGEIHGSATVNLKLTTGNSYSVIFWAAAPNAPYAVDFANKKMTVNYANAVSNDESRDAFYAVKTINVTGAQTETITLKRPFAQLNIGTNDYEASTSAGYTPTHSSVTVKNLKNTLNFFNGEVSGADSARVFASAAIPAGQEFPVAGYEYLAMNYLLVGTDKETVDVEFTYTDGTNAKTRKVGSVPVQRNYRTNIYGQLLTSDVDVNVEIVPEYNEPAHGLAELQNAALNGGEVTLEADVVLTTPLEVMKDMTINLNGKTISNANGYAFENYSNLTINGNGSMAGLGGIRSHSGKITINDGNFTCSSDWNVGTYNHILKAVNTEVVINGGVFDATVGGTTNAMINVSENAVVTINGGTFKNVNGVIPQFAPYMFTYEKNGKLIINDGEFYGGWRFNGETATTDIFGGKFTVSYDGQSFHASSTHVLTIYGGSFSLENGGKLNPANHVADGYKAVEVEGGYYTVLAHEVSNAEQLQSSLNVLANNKPVNAADAVIKLVDNIDLSGVNWAAIGTDEKPFCGTLNGNGKTIKNLTVSGTDYAAFIAYAGENAKIENLVLENVNINSTKHAAGVVCIAGSGLTIENVTVSGEINAASYAGGIIHNVANVTIKNCENNANVTANRAGGIASWTTVGANIENVVNNGNITGNVGASGIAHGFAGTMKNAVNNGNITSNNLEAASGIAGVQKAASTYEYCYNYGNVTSTYDNANSSAAGILGQSAGSASTLKYCANYGNITAEGSYAAGIAYSLYGTINASYCYNAGTVNGADGAGAIAPKAQYGTNDKASYCLNAGSITSANGMVYQGSNNNTSSYYYDGDVLKNAKDNTEVSTNEALTVLNGGTDNSFFSVENGKICVK